LNMWKYIREKQMHKYSLAILSFVWWNFAVCLLPIVASYFFRSTNNTILLSSFLAYCFTVLAVTVYFFIQRSREKIGGLIVSNAAILGTVGIMFIYMIFFFIFNYDDGVNKALSTNIVETIVASFILVFCITLMLTIPLIKEQVLADKPQKVIQTIKQSEAEGDRVISEINKEGIS